MSWPGRMQRSLTDSDGTCRVRAPALNPLWISIHLILTMTLAAVFIFIPIYRRQKWGPEKVSN